MAGIIVATTNNSVGKSCSKKLPKSIVNKYCLGVSGIAYSANLLIGKVFNSQGSGTYDAFVACITDAADRGADIINLSGGVSTFLFFFPRS